MRPRVWVQGCCNHRLNFTGGFLPFRPGPFMVPLCLAPGCFLFRPPGHASEAHRSSQHLFLGDEFFAVDAVSPWFMSLDSFPSSVRCFFAAIRCVFLPVAGFKSFTASALAFGCFRQFVFLLFQSFDPLLKT